jgi:hypothetical protein
MKNKEILLKTNAMFVNRKLKKGRRKKGGGNSVP